jgi:acetolactate synthase-1/3 small subunit
MSDNESTVIELSVRNHPGTMSHITGLFSRRAFNLDGIVCVPNPSDPETSRMLLLVRDDQRLEQVERQLLQLHDVLSLRHRADLDAGFFSWVIDAVPPKNAEQVPV